MTTLDGTAADLEALRTALGARLGVRADVVADLMAAAYRRSPVEGPDPDRDVEETAARMADAFSFLDGRPPGELQLRVFDPDPDVHHWRATGTIVQVNTEDSPFLLSTVTEEIGRAGYSTAEVLHPVLGVVRDADWRIERFERAREARTRESFIHVELDRRLPDAERAQLAADLKRVLGDAHAATRDFQGMRRRLGDVRQTTEATAGARYDTEEVQEVCAFLDWLTDDHFVLLGVRSYELVDDAISVVAGSGLGILADESTSTYARPTPLDQVPEDLRARIEGGELLTVARTNRFATVHRQQRMVYVGIKRVAPDGGLRGEDRILGLFAQKAFAEPASSTPVLRRKLALIMEREDVVAHSYDERALRTLWDAFPKQELFSSDTAKLQGTMLRLLESAARQNVRLLVDVDEPGRVVSALVALPRERFSAAIRMRLQALLKERYEADAVDYHLAMTDRDRTLLHFQLHVPARISEVSVAELEDAVIELTRTWEDELALALRAARGRSTADAVAARWAGRLPQSYQLEVAPEVAVEDLVHLEALDQAAEDGPAVRMTLQRLDDDTGHVLRFKLFKRGERVELSAFLPVLESLGLVAVEEVPHELEAPSGVGIHIHDFGVRVADAQAHLDLAADGERLAAAAAAIWGGRAEADSLNQLVLRAGVTWEDVVVLRAYRRYRRQVGTAFTEAYQNDALLEHADVAAALVRLFHVRFAPEVAARREAVDTTRATVVEGLEGVDRLDQDRILRGYLGMVDATVRTNRYVDRRGARGSPALSLKLASHQVPDLPKPVPHVEVFVYSPEVEGVHLRGGPVARGGIRWSDRQEDVRTEVLGLMKAQMVKNAVIVPTGSKGGFVLKRTVEPAGLHDEVQAQYESYIRALLDLTDDVVEGEVVPPPRVVRWDGDDPYLVVAADKGTATFSDVANAISGEYGFWLDDAFASGGSRGYDHKAMGITARGAWVAVERHFRELGLDIATDATRVVGIGDMSGDVFGNGLLQSRAVRLVAAFDHRHVFIDPEPDPEVSYQERARLHALPRSSWDDYDGDKISAGGGVWSRTAKQVELTDQVRELLRISARRISPPELIRALLGAPSDLLFAGGIGTFVKSSTESHTDVGDRVNDAIRIDGSMVGARVIGEGGNLALTQRGRIQYARRGGRVNTDAIDNAAGVDTSDREVNLKILLRAAVEHGDLDERDRDRLLADMTEEVAAAVLRDIYLQTWTVSSELAGSQENLEAYEQLMVDLSAAGGATSATGDVDDDEVGEEGTDAGRLDRSVEVLPSSAEMARRRKAGAGLTRPELAVLLGYAKVDLRDRLLASDLPDDPALRTLLETSFPSQATERFSGLLASHRLHRELVATALANDLVNRMGITYVSRTANELGRMAWEVAAAFRIAVEVTAADARWRRVEALDARCDAGLQLELKGRVDGLVDACVRAYLRDGQHLDIAKAVARDQPPFAELEAHVVAISSDRRRSVWAAAVERYVDLGIDPELAAELGSTVDLAVLPDVAGIARQTGHSVTHVADVLARVGQVLPLDRLVALLERVEAQDHWQRWEQRGLSDELAEVRRTATTAILVSEPDAEPDDAVAAYLGAKHAERRRVDALLEQLAAQEEPPLSAIGVAVRVLRHSVA